MTKCDITKNATLHIFITQTHKHTHIHALHSYTRVHLDIIFFSLVKSPQKYNLKQARKNAYRKYETNRSHTHTNPCARLETDCNSKNAKQKLTQMNECKINEISDQNVTYIYTSTYR